MAEIKIHLQNFDKLAGMLSQKPRMVVSAIATAIRTSAYVVEGEAKKALTYGDTRAIRTGRLRASTQVQELASYRAAIYPTVYYAIYVHEGTRYMRPRPFMTKAADQSVKQIQDIFQAEIDKALKL